MTHAADGGPGSLRAALATDYTAGSTIRFSDTLVSTPIVLDAPLVIHRAVTIDGGRGMALVGQGKGRIVTVAAAAAVVLTHLELRHGAALSGGAIENNGSLVLQGVSLHQNAAAVGAAVDNWGALVLVNTTVSANDATAASTDPFGGTIIANHPAATLLLLHATVVENRGTGSTMRSTGSLTLRNTVLGATTGSEASVPLCEALNPVVEHSLSPDASCGTQRTTNIGLTAADPASMPHWYAPSPGSALIDAASDRGCADPAVAGVDQRGMPRTSPCDIGAIEADPPVATHTAANARETRRATRAASRPTFSPEQTITRAADTSTPRSTATLPLTPTTAPVEESMARASHTPLAVLSATPLSSATPFVEATRPPPTTTSAPTRRPTSPPTEVILPTRTAIPTEPIAPTRTVVPTEYIAPTRTPFPTEPIAPTKTKTPFPTEFIAPTPTP